MIKNCFQLIISADNLLKIHIDMQDPSLFTTTTVTLVGKNKETLLVEDYLCEVVEKLLNKIIKLLNGNLILHPLLRKKSVGYVFNQWAYHLPNEPSEEEDEGLFWKYWLWSSSGNSKGIETWIYQDEDKFYLEVSPSYKWLFGNFEGEGQVIQGYDEFIQNYALIGFFSVSKNTLITWKNQCEYILSLI